jgi:hypothetical protein
VKNAKNLTNDVYAYLRNAWVPGQKKLGGVLRAMGGPNKKSLNKIEDIDLPRLVDSAWIHLNMNSSYRRTIGTSADQVDERVNASKVFDRLYGKYLERVHKYKQRQLKKKKPTFVPGQKVRIKLLTNLPFRKAYKERFSQEIYEIYKKKRTVPETFILLDPEDGNEMRGSFYAHELLSIDEELD